MARRWARLLWCVSFCCTAAWAASPQHGRLLTEQEAGDARAVTQRLQQPADPVTKKMAMQLRKQGERQMQRRNWSAAVKLFVGSTLVVTLLHPWAGGPGPAPALATLGGCVVIAVLVGTVESVTARLRMRAVPAYVMVALGAGAVALLATSWTGGGGR